MRLKLSLVGIGVLSHSGNRVCVRLRPSGPICTVRSSSASSADSGSSCFGATKSPNEGPELRRSEKVLAGRGCVEVADGGGRSATAVAKQRFCGRRDGRASSTADESRRRAGVRRAAMVNVWSDGGEKDCRLIHS